MKVVIKFIINFEWKILQKQKYYSPTFLQVTKFNDHRIYNYWKFCYKSQVFTHFEECYTIIRDK